MSDEQAAKAWLQSYVREAMRRWNIGPFEMAEVLADVVAETLMMERGDNGR